MKKNLIYFAAMMLVTTAAFAGMGGHGTPGRPGNGMPGGNGGMGIGAGPAGMMDLVVADDGTVLTIKRTPGDPAVPGSGTIELVAIAPTGSVLWSWTTPGAIHVLEVSGTTVLVSTVDANATPGDPAYGANSMLHALALYSGAELWTLEVEGRIHNVEPTANVIYAIVSEQTESTNIVPRGSANGPGPGAGEITLYAISYQGVVNWTVSLN